MDHRVREESHKGEAGQERIAKQEEEERRRRDRFNLFVKFRHCYYLKAKKAMAEGEGKVAGISSSSEIELGFRPFSGLVICVTGLSKESRKQVMEVTKRLGGRYSPGLHPECTHLVVQSFGGWKLEHTLKYGLSNGLFVVTLGWFVDSVRKNVRLCESPYFIHSAAKVGTRMEDWFVNLEGVQNSCIPISSKQILKPSKEIRGHQQQNSEDTFETNQEYHLVGHLVYIDSDISVNLRCKVVDAVTREGAVLVDQWFVGCGANYVVCEGSSVKKYLGLCDNIVSPLWFLKTSKERSMRRFVGISADLARQVGLMLENLKDVITEQETSEERFYGQRLFSESNKVSQAERLEIVNLAKCGIRSRRARHLQSCEVLLRPLNPSNLLESICWSISEPPSMAALYADSFLSTNDLGIGTDMLYEGQGLESEISFAACLRPLTESEKNDLIFKNHFLTILFPLDRFAEMGPSSRTYFSETGFTCLQLLDFIYDFYQENMSDHEIKAAIHTDSRYAEQLRSMYCSEMIEDCGTLIYKRIDLLLVLMVVF